MWLSRVPAGNRIAFIRYAHSQQAALRIDKNKVENSVEWMVLLAPTNAFGIFFLTAPSVLGSLRLFCLRQVMLRIIIRFAHGIASQYSACGRAG